MASAKRWSSNRSENPLGRILDKERDRRLVMFRRAIEYVDIELVPGDVLEFGVHSGLSLAMLGHCCGLRWDRELPRRLVGFDSYEGLPDDPEGHPRWRRGACATNEVWHPVLAPGDRVSAAAVLELFARCGLPAPELETGRFEDTLPRVLGHTYCQAALVHVDCDLYDAARFVLFQLEPFLQDGSVLLFDDWFHHRADPGKGEARAFAELLESYPHWKAVPWQAYSTCSNSFILRRS